MSEAAPIVFISYSRTDSDFVGQLEVSLQSSGFRTWVDRSEMKGGLDWLSQIQEALDQCQVVVVVLSPMSMQSEYVLKEYRYAQAQKKLVIPLEYQPTPRVPWDLHTIQRIIFHSNFDQGLQGLLHTLSRVNGLSPILPSATPNNDSRRQPGGNAFVPPPPSQSDVKQEELYPPLSDQHLASDSARKPTDSATTNQAKKQPDRQTTAPPPNATSNDANVDPSFAEIFEQFFGKTASAPKTQNASGTRGADIRQELTITFEEAVFGCQKVIEVLRWENCATCRGTGAQPGTQTQLCHTCQGTGEIRRVQQSIFGKFVNVTTCDRCQGKGNVPTTLCITCRGQSRVRNNRRVLVNIPAGVDNGINVRVRDEGDVSPNGGSPGNFYVALTVTPHPSFIRKGSDLYTYVTLDKITAQRGGEVSVASLDNQSIPLTIFPQTADGQEFCLKGNGVPVVHSTARGNLYVKVSIHP
jgi:DnaJ-class molecular chaperone